MADNTEILRRRTFAIIAHPDAGKTSLTEKLLLFGGQIQVAGAVKSNKIKKTAIANINIITKKKKKRKMKIMENEKHPLDDLKNDEITKKKKK